ncbi:MAG: Malonyl CoA-acyl carrier protein transacylase [uncultured Thermomicrobiales bacterium]|uniref:Malonyl CoA-acyl carrier protein transacylase n=1 Tax=uncultured Thermomicrobiales bacterium TaxID=1645740 RepID=A0A6J4U555_9BACT|nr:MAG: Malonyl CoA-acyl carrier protein transacylase [uncultured Thermomicrobiales bacterium]
MTLREELGDRLAFVFPGQGSQAVGMGRVLSESSSAARETLREADEVLGIPLSRLLFEGPAAELDDTFNAQPALLTVSVASLRALHERADAEGVPLTPLVVAGHSLGQFSALVGAGVIDFSDALHLVRERGRLMKEAGERRPGGMAAVIGLDDERLAEICREAASEGIINVANLNCPGQTVISGEVAALERAMDLAKAAGARRVARLPVSIAAHSPLMQDVSPRLTDRIDALPFREPTIPVVGNVSGEPITSVAGLREELAYHVERPVQWTTSIQAMVGLGATTFVELEPGQVLAGLIKRIDRAVTTIGAGALLGAGTWQAG